MRVAGEWIRQASANADMWNPVGNSEQGHFRWMPSADDMWNPVVNVTTTTSTSTRQLNTSTPITTDQVN
jgi:hypothetical protein